MQNTVNSRYHGLVLFNPYLGLLSGATTPGQSQPGSHDNVGVLCIPQSSSIIGTSPLDFLVSYTGHSLDGVLPHCRKAVGVFYSPADWATWDSHKKMLLFKKGKKSETSVLKIESSILIHDKQNWLFVWSVFFFLFSIYYIVNLFAVIFTTMKFEKHG